MSGPGDSGGWSSTVNLLTGGDISNPVQANFPDANYKTIQFGVNPPDPTDSKGIFSAIALVTWSVEGNSITREITVGDGVTISAPAQAFGVQVIDTTHDFGQTMGVPYQVTVSITPGSRPSIDQPPLLQDFDLGDLTLPPAGTLLIPVPQNVGIVSLRILGWSLDVANANPRIRVGQLASSFPVVFFFRTYAQTEPDSGFVPLFPGTQKIQIENLDGANAASINVIWGIDG